MAGHRGSRPALVFAAMTVVFSLLVGCPAPAPAAAARHHHLSRRQVVAAPSRNVPVPPLPQQPAITASRVVIGPRPVGQTVGYPGGRRPGQQPAEANFRTSNLRTPREEPVKVRPVGPVHVHASNAARPAALSNEPAAISSSNDNNNNDNHHKNPAQYGQGGRVVPVKATGPVKVYPVGPPQTLQKGGGNQAGGGPTGRPPKPPHGGGAFFSYAGGAAPPT